MHFPQSKCYVNYTVQVRTGADMWDYIEDTYLPTLYTLNWPYTIDEANVIVGRVRMQQLRVKPTLGSFTT